MRFPLARQFRALAPMFRPPFDGLWIAALLYFFWCYLVHPDSQLLRGNLPDPDDYMYLDQVLDWLKGQGWYDSIQHRLDPPAGGFIHFSRLPQIPMAAAIWLFERLGLPPVGAATLMAVFEPLFLFAGFFAAIRWLGRRFMPADWAGVTAYVALFATGLLAMFAPGHVDHHGLVVLLVTVALGCTVRMLQEPEDIRWGFGAGFALALTLAIALEVLPWLILISVWVGLWATVEGGKAARSGLAYGLSLYLSSAALLALTRPPDILPVPDVAAFSIVYLFFTGSIAAAFAGIALAAGKAAVWRWILGTGTAAVTGVMFLCRFPALLGGPWGGVNPALASLILDNVTEATPLAGLKGSWFLTIASVLGPLLALGACLRFFRGARPRDRWSWGLMTVLLTAALLLTVFYQYRFVGMLGAFLVVPLAVLLQRGWMWIGAHKTGRGKVFAEIGLLLLVGPLPAVLAPALVDGRSFNTGVLLFPAPSASPANCDMYALEKILKSPRLYNGKPRLIMNTMGLGPELLFRTPHMVIAAPYHEDVAGNLDSVRFFSATDPARAEAVVRRRDAGIVVACKVIPRMYTDLAAIRKAMPDTAGGGTDRAAAPQPPMILRLITGQQLPSWLKPVRSPGLHNYVVYEIAPAPAARKSRARE